MVREWRTRWGMDEGGCGECQKEGPNVPVGRVAMSGPGDIHGVPR